jgi:ABC-type glycerol-3-phosphate transport system substrate-binding protein
MPHKKWAEKYTILEEVRMKKALSLLLALVMVFALTACGQEKKDEAPAGDVEMKYMI